MNPEVEKLLRHPKFEEVLNELKRVGAAHAPPLQEKGEPVVLGGLWGSAQAFFSVALSANWKGNCLLLVSDPEEAELFAEDLESFGAKVSIFPALPDQGSDPRSEQERLAVVESLDRGAQSQLICSSPLALIQPTPSREALRESRLTLRSGQSLDLADFLKTLGKADFRKRPFVSHAGELSQRGAILDFFPLTAAQPLRLEIFEDRIESMRHFDPESQRSTEEISEFSLLLSKEESLEQGNFWDHLSENILVIEIEPLRILQRQESLRLQDDEFAKRLKTLQSQFKKFKAIELHSLPSGKFDFDIRSTQGLGSAVRSAGETMEKLAAQTPRIHLFCRNEPEQKRIGSILSDQGFAPGENFTIEIGALSNGFRFPSLGVSFLHHNELLGVPKSRRPGRIRRDLPTQAVRSFLDLREGDLVVHEIHGVGRFLGTQRIQKGQGEEDHLVVEFAEEARLFVPVSRVDLVQRYIGAGGVEPKLDKLGSGSFLRRKENVQKSLVDLAAELLEVQALRQSRVGNAYPHDDEMQRDLEASFPFQETEDQLSVIQEIKSDLESARPMDRLLCGDVGYGKTELAIRAAFKVVSAGKQVAVLVPTTLLAEQHEKTFRERLAEYPVRVEAISRFRTDKEAKKIVEEAKLGQVDILIGTHRILSSDVGFKDLGLVIIDEEQRFGVRHKEKLKQLRATVDVLTLTATPIPRTLHMAMVGIRDISSLTTPPLGRDSVETKIKFREDDEAIRHTIRSELNRGGQVFFLHNRVHSIGRVAARVAELVPEAKLGVGHGQMGEGELSEVMDKFVAGEIDILVSTSIIESGLDIPRANTILIDNAQQFGLADLHQLRGRVGRWKHKAYCYLLIPKAEPLAPAAKARIKAIEELQELGSGFAISMRDLEIRGAGNLLGAEQSGHIGAVGYDFYCRLLKATVASMTAGEKGKRELSHELDELPELELAVPAFLPQDYVEDAKLRLGLLREFDEIEDKESRDKAERSLRDRFGPVPQPAKRLLDLFFLKRALAPAGIRSLHFAKDRFLVEYRDRLRLSWALRESFPDIRYIESGKAHLLLPASVKSSDQAFDLLIRSCKPLDQSSLNAFLSV